MSKNYVHVTSLSRVGDAKKIVRIGFEKPHEPHCAKITYCASRTRAAFLQDEEHPVYFIYTPKHCSWLNQIEIWFGILSRKLIKRGNFTSTEDLKEKINKFIDYFNIVLAKPFKWTYNGKPCKA